MSKLRIGMYEQDITPVGPVNLPGQFYRRISKYVEEELKVNVFACESDDEQLIIAATDATSINDEIFKEIKDTVSKKCAEIDTSKIIISATHTHTAGDYANKRGRGTSAAEKYLPEGMRYVPLEENEECRPSTEYRELFINNISDGIIKAWNKREDAYISAEFGRAVVGHSRRVEFNDHTAKMYGIADVATFETMESGNDTGVELLYVFNKDKKPMGAIVNVACPSQVLEHCSFVSSDYWGKTRKFVKEEIGDDFVTVGICAAAGCQAPRDMIRFILPDTMDPNLVRENPQKPRKTDPDMYAIEGAIEIGERLTSVIVQKLKKAKENMSNDSVLKHETLKLNLPLRKVTETDKNNAQEAIKTYIERANKTEFDAYDMAAMHVSAGILDRYKLQDTEQFKKIEVHIARLGNIAFATNPFELFLDYGNKIRARSEAEQTFLIQLACGASGYLPTKRAEEGGHYSAYVASGFVGHEGGELLVATTLDKIKELFN